MYPRASWALEITIRLVMTSATAMTATWVPQQRRTKPYRNGTITTKATTEMSRTETADCPKPARNNVCSNR